MPGALPVELRERVVAAHHNGEGTYAELAERFGVGEASVSRKRLLQAQHLAWLTETIESMPDSTAAELVEGVEELFGVAVSETTVNRTRRRLGFTPKKGTSSRRSAIGKTL